MLVLVALVGYWRHHQEQLEYLRVTPHMTLNTYFLSSSRGWSILVRSSQHNFLKLSSADGTLHFTQLFEVYPLQMALCISAAEAEKRFQKDIGFLSFSIAKPSPCVWGRVDLLQCVKPPLFLSRTWCQALWTMKWFRATVLLQVQILFFCI